MCNIVSIDESFLRRFMQHTITGLASTTKTARVIGSGVIGRRRRIQIGMINHRIMEVFRVRPSLKEGNGMMSLAWRNCRFYASEKVGRINPQPSSNPEL